MQIVEKILEKRWYYHSVIWLGIILLVMLLMTPNAIGFIDKVIDTITLIVPSFILIYCLFYLQDHFFPKKQYLVFLILAIIITRGIGYFATYFTAYLYDTEISNIDTDIDQWIQNMFIIGILALISRVAKRGVISQLELQKLQVEKMKVEMDLLKAQLNPHFLFNTINNICGVNQVNPENGTEMLINLADLLRYYLEFSTAERIPIHKEIQLMESFIALEKMRLRNNCSVEFVRPEADVKAFIAPLLLLPFVENAFKHGTHTSLPSFIIIKLSYSLTKLEMIIENSLFENKKVIKNNIGQKNTVQRLQIIYPNQHQLKIEETKELFRIHLNINL